jgi:hypothetical protein
MREFLINPLRQPLPEGADAGQVYTLSIPRADVDGFFADLQAELGNAHHMAYTVIDLGNGDYTVILRCDLATLTEITSRRTIFLWSNAEMHPF